MLEEEFYWNQCSHCLQWSDKNTSLFHVQAIIHERKKKYKSEVIQRVITPNRDEIENEVYRALKAYVPFKNVEDLMAFWQCFIKDIENLLGEALQKHV